MPDTELLGPLLWPMPSGGYRVPRSPFLSFEGLPQSPVTEPLGLLVLTAWGALIALLFAFFLAQQLARVVVPSPDSVLSRRVLGMATGVVRDVLLGAAALGTAPGTEPRAAPGEGEQRLAGAAAAGVAGGKPAGTRTPATMNIPRHIAVIMDGNRRYGKRQHGEGSQGHWDGGRVLVDFVDWCIAAGVGTLTCYAFSTENWNRPKAEVDVLMTIFERYCNDIQRDAVSKGIRLRVLASDSERIPPHMRRLFAEMEAGTTTCTTINLNLCVSYGSRGEITNAVRGIAAAAAAGTLNPEDITEDLVSAHLLSGALDPRDRDPDLLVRTSGEKRLSNFLLWQLAYTEIVFVDKLWPEMTQADLGECIGEFQARKRRFGK